MTDITEVREEIAAENEATREARREAERAAAHEAERKARVEFHRVYAERLLPHVRASLVARGEKYRDWYARVDDATGHLIIGDPDRVAAYDLFWNLDVQPERTRINTYRSRPTGRVRLVVGEIGNRTSYPERKDGTHNYPDIAAQLVSGAISRYHRDASETNRRANRGDAEDVREKLGVSEYYGPMSVAASSSLKAPIRVKIEIAANVTPEKAIEIHAALRQLGLV